MQQVTGTRGLTSPRPVRRGRPRATPDERRPRQRAAEGGRRPDQQGYGLRPSRPARGGADRGIPFTRYGLAPGEVTRVSADAVDDPAFGLVYPLRASLAENRTFAGDRWPSA